MIPHPCMTHFLIEFMKNHKVKAYYDGNHIICVYPLDNIPEGNFIPLYEYGFAHLVNSFQDMTQLEQAALRNYFDYNIVQHYTPIYENQDHTDYIDYTDDIRRIWYSLDKVNRNKLIEYFNISFPIV